MKEDRRRERRTEEGGTRERGKLRRKGRSYVLHTRGIGRKGRWERKRRRTTTITASSYHCTVINSLLVGESVPRLGPGLMTNHLHPALRPWLFMIRQLIRAGQGASWASSWVGVVTPGTRWQPQMGPLCHVPSPPPLPSTLTVTSAHHLLVTGDNSVLWTFPHLSTLSTNHMWQQPTQFSLNRL